MNQKIKWQILLVIDSLLLLWALSTNIYLLHLVVILLSFLIYKNGNAILFKEYDEKRRKKRESYKRLQEAVNESVHIEV